MGEIILSSGMQVNPATEIEKLIKDTSFENNAIVQGHLKGISESFLLLAATDPGQRFIYSLEGLTREVKDKKGFHDVITIALRFAKQISGNILVQIGIFLAIVGIVMALVASLGPQSLVAAVFGGAARGIILSSLWAIGKGISDEVKGWWSGEEVLRLKEE